MPLPFTLTGIGFDRSDASQLQATYGTGLAPLSQFARGLPFNDPKELLIAFRGANDQQLQTMMSPMVRMLACEVDELPNHRHVSIALERLATMDVVGTRTHYDAFRAILGQLLGANVLGDDDPASFQTVGVLAQTLSRNGIVANLLEQDVALYSYAQEAITSGLADRESLAQRDTQTI